MGDGNQGKVGTARPGPLGWCPCGVGGSASCPATRPGRMVGRHPPRGVPVPQIATSAPPARRSTSRSDPAVPAALVPAASAVSGRDLTVDLLRAIAMVLVAVGHWLVVVPRYESGRFDGVNAL